MAIVFQFALVVHVLAATFWAGTTFAMARTAGQGSAQLFGPQMGAAAAAILAGALLWTLMFGANPGSMALGVGAAAAIGAVLVQAVIIGRVRRGLPAEPSALARAALAHRIASGLLAVCIACMVLQ